jgi:antitoxin CcdA
MAIRNAHILLGWIKGQAVKHSKPERLPEAPSRRPTNVTLPEALLREARNLEINLSQACERGLALAVAERRQARWLAENQAAITGWNTYVDEQGLPLAGYRQF